MIVTIREASELLKITSNLLYKYSHSDNFPEPIGKRNGRANLYKLSDLEEFLQSPDPKHKYLDKPTIVVKVRCINGCKGEKVPAIIIKGEKPPKKICSNCLEFGYDRSIGVLRKDFTWEQEEHFNARMIKKKIIRIFKKGDPEFEKISSEIMDSYKIFGK